MSVNKNRVRPRPQGGRNTPLERALAVFQAMIQAEDTTNLSRLAMFSGLPKTTVHRLIDQLLENELMSWSTNERSLTVGPHLAVFATTIMRSTMRFSAEQSVLRALSEALGESCEINILENDSVMCIDSTPARPPLVLNLRAGDVAPLHCTSSGKLYLAYMGRTQRDRWFARGALPRMTIRTLTDQTELKQELARIRRNGCAFNEEEWLPGVVGAGVPIFAEQRNVIATISVSAPSSRVPFSELREFVPLLREAAERLGNIYRELI